MKVRAVYCGCRAWYAIDDDTYDGAPDTRGLASLIGLGSTREEAIADLMTQIDEFGEVEK